MKDLNRRTQASFYFWERVTFISLAFIAFCALPACRLSPHERAELVVKHVSRELALNDGQKSELEKLANEATLDFKSTGPQRKELADEIEKQILTEKADVPKLQKMLDAQHSRRKELTDKWLGKIAEFHSRLSPEQKQKAAKMMKKYGTMFRGRFGGDDDSSHRE